MLIRPDRTPAAHVAIDTLAIGYAAPLIYVARLWMAFADITLEFLRGEFASPDAAITADKLIRVRNAIDGKCEVIELAAWRAGARRDSGPRQS